ncbi:MAG: glutathione S-transferase family protein [Myxococcales bacterium]|nr:glutathione S-transferase family protein [Myxococcales bacterium]USN51437.1 MAG: glutathione S-transferase family protein [Myxococcales bacterium]
MAQSKAPPFTLYEYRPSPFCVAVRIALNECEVSFTPREVDHDKPRTAAFLKRSPFGTLPALVEHRPGGELAIFETTAILLFLAERFQDKSLGFQDLSSKAQSLSWLSFIGSSFAVQLWSALEESGSAESQKGMVERKTQEFFATLDILDKHLARRAFLSGDYSVADTFATPLLDLLEMVKGIESDAYPHVFSWRERLRSRPSYKGVWPHEKEIK